MNKDKIYEIVKKIQSISKLINKKTSNNAKCEKFTLSTLMVVNQLRLGKVRTLTELSKTLGIPNSTVSVVVDRLVNMGIVRRERDKDDRRKVLLCIEGEGIDQEKKILKYHMDNFGKLFKNATEDEIGHILKGLETLESVIMRS